MDNKEIRRQNMLALAEELGSLRKLGDATETPPAYLSQVKNKSDDRGMGDEVARRMEKKLGKPHGWMDVLHQRAGGAGKPDVSAGPEIRGQVPLISWVRAGKFDEPSDPHRVGDAEDWLPMPKRAGPNTYCLRVEGDSMTSPHGKSYPEGAIIFVDPDQRSPASGRAVIAKLKGSHEVTFKVFVREAGKVFLKPLNHQYPPIGEQFKVLGTVIGKWEDA